MSDGSYLWDRTGERDPLVDVLVSKLASKRPVGRRRVDMTRWLAPLVSAAAVLLVVIPLGGAEHGATAVAPPDDTRSEPADGSAIVVSSPRGTTTTDVGGALNSVAGEMTDTPAAPADEVPSDTISQH